MDGLLFHRRIERDLLKDELLPYVRDMDPMSQGKCLFCDGSYEYQGERELKPGWSVPDYQFVHGVDCLWWRANEYG